MPRAKATQGRAAGPRIRSQAVLQGAQQVPKLTKLGYSTQPSLQQLAALAREDPALLASVANFVVSLKGTGQIRWLQPVDLRGLDLDETVHLSQGTVEVSLCLVAILRPLGEGWQGPSRACFGVQRGLGQHESSSTPRL